MQIAALYRASEFDFAKLFDEIGITFMLRQPTEILQPCDGSSGRITIHCRFLRFVVVFAAGLAFLSPAIFGQTSPQIRFRPIRTTATNTFASASPTNTASATNDPRLAELARWLQRQVNALQATNSSQQIQTAAVPATATMTNMVVRLADDFEIQRRSNGTVARLKRSQATPAHMSSARVSSNSVEPEARRFLRAKKNLLECDDPDGELVLRREVVDDLGRNHLRFAQVYKGLPVWPCELLVHTTPDGGIDLIESTTAPSPRLVDVSPTFTAEQAIERAQVQLFNKTNATAHQPDLIVFAPLDKSPRLAWKFDMNSTLTDALRCVVDAHTGEVLSAISLVHDAAVVGSGIDAQGINRTLNLWQNGSTYYMANTAKSMFVPSSLPPDPDTTFGQILIYDSRNTPATSSPQNLGNPSYSASANANSGWAPDAVSAAFGMSEVYDYFLLRHGRNSFDGNGSSLIGCVRVGINYPNAFWTQQLKLMAFGDGYPRSLDVCGHEVTHGVIFSIGDGGVLDYVGQSGALNEAFADIFGEMVEARTSGTNDWLIGSQLVTPIRNMASPNAFGQPASMSQFVVTSGDNGGVHINSGIINRAYFLLSAGLSGAIGSANAERIFYRALTLHLQKQSRFIDARHACISSAEALFGVGSAQVLKTAEAFDAVGIVDAPASTPPGSIPAVQAPDSTLCLRFDFFNQEYYLVRRETARGDSSTGTALYFSAPSRVSVSGDGSLALFVTEDHDLAILATDGSTVDPAGFPNTVHSVALSPDGRYAAIILLDGLGNPTDQIHRIDLQSNTSQSFDLYAPSSEGDTLAVVEHADVMDFMADGRVLIYDALCRVVTAQGDVFDGWAIFALDVTTGGIQTLTDPNSDYNVGNPALGNTKNYLVTFEVFNNSSGESTVLAGNIFSGQIGIIGTVNGLGVPGYTGDDSAIVYSQVDSFVDTDFSLRRQAVAADGITTVGSSTAWLSDADFGVIYRRGAFVSSNALPTISITNPVAGQFFTNPPSITIQASAADTGGSVLRVEFYRGSSLIGQDTTSPYSISWSSPPVGGHLLTARAIDNLGGVKDSAQFQIFVQPPPDATKPTVSITNPPSARTYTNAQTVIISATAADNVGVVNIAFYDGATLKGSDATPPYSHDWSFTAADNGAHAWSARAYDAAGNVATSSVVTLTVSIDTNVPLVAISSPTNGANLTISPTTVSGTASDPGSPASGLSRVEVRVNSGNWSNATGTASWSRSVTLLPCGNAIEVRSRDNAGNYSAIASNFVTFTPPNTAPNTPVNVSPVAGARNVSVTPTLQASPFTDPDPACLSDVHAASQWQVLNRPGTVVVADSGTDTVNRISWTIPPAKLYYGSNYQWQVRYRDSRNGWSSYSARTFFTNGGPSLVGVKLGTNFVLNWPTNSIGFGLQWSTNLGSANWSNATPLPVIVNGQYAVTNSAMNSFRFYRLRK